MVVYVANDAKYKYIDIYLHSKWSRPGLIVKVCASIAQYEYCLKLIHHHHHHHHHHQHGWSPYHISCQPWR